jgi:uncharacterized protein
MARRPFRLGRSLTGLGLFATHPIKKRARIAEYKGPILGLKDAEEEERKGNRYLYEINSRWTIDGKKRGNIARYFNHSCNPNTESYTVGHRVFVRTLRNIKPEEELTYDYGIDYLRNVIGKSKCKCGRCRRRRAKRSRELRALKVRKAQRLTRQRKQARAGKTSAAKTSVAKTSAAKTRGRAKR